MTSTVSTKRRPSAAARRTGYTIAVLVNATLLYLVNVWPGWDAVPFLDEDTPQVLGWVNASIVAGIAANLVYLFDDSRWVRALGDVVTMGVGLAALMSIWQVFPFDFGDQAFDWAVVFRVLLAIGMLGSAIGIVARVVSLVKDTPSRS
jgi:hypothetical protein